MGFSRQGYWMGCHIPSPRDLPPPRDWTQVSCGSCIGRRILYHWATWEALHSLLNSFGCTKLSRSSLSPTLPPTKGTFKHLFHGHLPGASVALLTMHHCSSDGMHSPWVGFLAWAGLLHFQKLQEQKGLDKRVHTEPSQQLLVQPGAVSPTPVLIHPCSSSPHQYLSPHAPLLLCSLMLYKVQGSGPQLYWLKRPVTWNTVLPQTGGGNWSRKWQPTPVLLPGESQGRGSLLGCHLWGHTESDTTEAT